MRARSGVCVSDCDVEASHTVTVREGQSFRGRKEGSKEGLHPLPQNLNPPSAPPPPPHPIPSKAEGEGRDEGGMGMGGSKQERERGRYGS